MELPKGFCVMKLVTKLAALGLSAFLGTTAFADLPDLKGQEVVVVTENAYPPLQFVDPASGKAVGWEYAAIQSMKEDGTNEALNKKWFLDFKIGG